MDIVWKSATGLYIILVYQFLPTNYIDKIDCILKSTLIKIKPFKILMDLLYQLCDNDQSSNWPMYSRSIFYRLYSYDLIYVKSTKSLYWVLNVLGS